MASAELRRDTNSGRRSRVSSGRAVAPDLMINISGGVDSVYAAYDTLNSGRSVLLHHCVLKSRTNRWSQERKAVDHALKYFVRKGLDNFSYLETSFDYGKISYLIYDVELIGFLTGLVLRNPKYKSVNEVLVSINSDDPSAKDPNTPRRVKANLLTDTVMDRKIQFTYPYIEISKRDMLKNIPKDLLAGLWWCRTPVGGNKCGRCRPCREINEMAKSLT